MLSSQLAHAGGHPAVEQAQTAVPVPSAVRDVALEGDGELRGQVLDAQGHARPGMPVLVVRQDKEVARTQTDAEGRFVVHGLTGGVYQVATPVGAAVYRAWAPRTAPPAATQLAIITPDQTVVRGQFGTSALGWLANPWVLAAIVAAAIAIPLALDDDDDAS
jgi:hypothetical protein